jgi:hypothetical protein
MVRYQVTDQTGMPDQRARSEARTVGHKTGAVDIAMFAIGRHMS